MTSMEPESSLNWKIADQVQVMVYGKGKTGKTFGAYSFPRPVSMDFDKGNATANNPAFIKKYGNKEIKFKKFYERDTKSGGVVVTHNAFDDACKFFDWMMSPAYVNSFDTWIIDSGTSLSEACLNKAIVLLGTKEFHNMSKTHATALSTGLVFPKIQDYGSERSLVEQFIRMLLDSRKHVVFICHEKEVTNDDGQVTKIVPLLTGKGPDAVGLMFDEIYNLQVKIFGNERKRFLVTESDGLRMAGSRLGVPDGTEWSFESIHAALKAAHPSKE